ncbi:MIP/aquaporin family protein [Actinoallomurus vinaceus]|uniref:MIP/aquaporin family protein n=1 Tax=Actinoallomurus vinaceus TaxID=1080074 RepID=A0ABP8U211_9ACTN
MHGNAAIFAGEFIGTAILILMGDGVVAAVLLPRSKAFAGGWIVITFGWGFGVLAGAYSALNLSGGHINPAVTLGIAVYGGQIWGEVPIRIVAQILGAIVGAVLVWLAYLGHFKEAEEPTLGVFSTIPQIRDYVQNLVTEIIATFVLVFFILATGLQQGPVAKIAATGLGVLLVSLLVVGIGLSLGGPTGYAINPARDLGPRIAHAFLPIPNKGSSDWAYAWIPVVGPIVGAMAAAGVARLVF